MRRSPEEKLEIIHLVEHSNLSVKRTLEELDVPRSTFYRWYQQYQEDGPDGLRDQKPNPRQFWNRIPEQVKEQVVDLALQQPEKSSRQLAWHFVDKMSYFISESSVYRILRASIWCKAQPSKWCLQKTSLRSPPNEYTNSGRPISPTSR